MPMLSCPHVVFRYILLNEYTIYVGTPTYNKLVHGVNSRMTEEVRHTCEAPSVSLLGIGGCGVNLVRRVRENVGTLVNFSNFLDSSDANQRDEENVYIMTNGNGGGKMRSHNSDELRARIPHLADDVLGDSDVYILVGSLAGATGGVSIPLLVKELTSRGKKVIIGVVGETTDKKGAENTYASLKTLNLLTERQGLYLPTVITHTSRKRTEADRYMVAQISSIIGVLRLPCYEIDKNDRLNWLDASHTVKVDPGMHMVYGIPQGYDITELTDLHDSTMIADSMLNLGVAEDEHAEREYVELPITHSRFAKDGQLANTKTPLTGIIIDASETLAGIIAEIEEKDRMFKNQVKSKTAESRLKLAADEDDEDIIL